MCDIKNGPLCNIDHPRGWLRAWHIIVVVVLIVALTAFICLKRKERAQKMRAVNRNQLLIQHEKPSGQIHVQAATKPA